jgi:hypothetical protein
MVLVILRIALIVLTFFFVSLKDLIRAECHKHFDDEKSYREQSPAALAAVVKRV